MSLFDPVTRFKPFTHPEVALFKKAILDVPWTVDSFDLLPDVQDYHVKINDTERLIIKRTLLAISQIEAVAVKEFWPSIGQRIPKPEFKQVGIVFGANEVVHSDAYSHLLEILGFNGEFDLILEEPVIKGRVDYLQKYIKNQIGVSDRAYALTLTLFSLYVENVSLFAQFAIMKSFAAQRNLMKGIDNIVQATIREEEVHAQFGAYVVNLIRKEHPEWFDDDFNKLVMKASHKAYKAECDIIDWIFEAGELDFLSAAALKEFIKNRFNKSLAMIGYDPIFEIDAELLKVTEWFDIENKTLVAVDFFHKHSTSYSKNTRVYDKQKMKERMLSGTRQ